MNKPLIYAIALSLPFLSGCHVFERGYLSRLVTLREVTGDRKSPGGICDNHFYTKPTPNDELREEMIKVRGIIERRTGIQER